ncbi:MAG: beta-ureidopropionase [Oceanicoccus sp.]
MELPYFSPGENNYEVADTEHGKLGIFICFDRHFAEVSERYSALRPDLLFVLCCTSSARSNAKWFAQAQTYAQTLNAHTFFVNRVGVDIRFPNRQFFGTSLGVGPSGNLLVKASSNKDEILIIK